MQGNTDERTIGAEIENTPGVERFRGASFRCGECEALAFDWIRNDDGGITIECTFCGTPALSAADAELGEEQRDRLEQHERDRVMTDGGIERREATGYRQASLADRLDAGQRYTVDSSPVGEPEPELELPSVEPLSGRQVAVWVAVELNGYEPRDFARQVGIKPSTARTHLLRARERIGGWSR